MRVTEQQVRELVRAAFSALGPRRFDFYNPNHRPAGDEHGGEFAPKDEGFIEPGEAAAILGELKLRHGTTYNPVGNFTPIKGFAVSIFPEKSTVIEGRDLTEQDLTDYWKANASAFRDDERANFGAWVDTSTGKVYLDVTYVEQDRTAAIKLGAKHNQIAIYDLENKVEIPTGGTGTAFGALHSPGERHIGTAQAVRGRGERGTKEGHKRLRFYWDEGLHPRGRTVPGTNSGSFAPSDNPQADSPDVVSRAGKDEAVAAANLLDIQQHEAADVEGDSWNKTTAYRLEQQYRSAKPALEAIIAEAEAGNADVDVRTVDPEDAPVVPEEWDMLSEDQQSDVESKWKEYTADEFLQSEVDSWRENSAEDDARAKLAWDFTKGDDTEWASDAIAEWRADREAEGEVIEYNDQEILDALTVEHDTGNWPVSKGTDISLSLPDVPASVDANQLALEGFEPKSYALTAEQEDRLLEMLSSSFEDRANTVAESMDPPEYLSESVSESQDMYWSEMDDSDKFNWAEKHTDIISDAQSEYDSFMEGATVAFTVPVKFDPLSKDPGSVSYKETQAFAKYVSIERGAQIMVERGLAKDIEDAREKMKHIDTTTWDSWKGSSTSQAGWAMQVATADELGGRLLEHPLAPSTVEHVRNSTSYPELRAMVRAKWETSQYMLDKAGVHTVEVFRGVDFGRTESQRELLKEAEKSMETVHFDIERKGQIWQGTVTRLPTLRVERNGAASTTVDQGVANSWGNDQYRVVLRAKVPRTAVISVPAYGDNIHKEHEVVVAGTAWKKWDAWYKTAPSFKDVP